MKLSMRKWINPDEADDIAASKFLCGGGSWWQLDNKGGEEGLVWFGMVWYGGRDRGEVPWYIGTGPPQTDTWECAGGQVPTYLVNVCYLTTQPCRY